MILLFTLLGNLCSNSKWNYSVCCFRWERNSMCISVPQFPKLRLIRRPPSNSIHPCTNIDQN